MKRLITVLTAFLLAVTVVPFHAFATSNNFTNSQLPPEAAA